MEKLQLPLPDYRPVTARPPRGFSIIDLLITIAVITILVSLLLPAVGAVRANARGARCLSNVRTILVAFNSYRVENGRRWTSFPIPPRTWVTDLRKNVGNTEVFFCPDAIEPSTLFAAGQPYGTSHTVWGPGTGTPAAPDIGNDSASYGINTWLYTRSWPNAAYHDAYPTFFIDPTNAPNPSVIPFVADCVWVGGLPFEGDTPPPELENPLVGNVWVPEMRRFCVNRHHKRLSVGFLDGGAESVRVDSLWQLNWHNGWKPRSVVLP